MPCLLLVQVCFYMNYVFVATYMSRLAPLPLLPKEALAVTAFGLALYTLAAPTIGFIADRVGTLPCHHQESDIDTYPPCT